MGIFFCHELTRTARKIAKKFGAEDRATVEIIGEYPKQLNICCKYKRSTHYRFFRQQIINPNRRPNMTYVIL